MFALIDITVQNHHHIKMCDSEMITSKYFTYILFIAAAAVTAAATAAIVIVLLKFVIQKFY